MLGGKALFRWYLNTDCWRPRHPDYRLNLQGSVAHGLKISAFGWKYNLLLFPRQIDRFKIWFWIFLLCLRGKQKQKRDFFLRRKIDKIETKILGVACTLTDIWYTVRSVDLINKLKVPQNVWFQHPKAGFGEYISAYS